jgi:hypothetical protein
VLIRRQFTREQSGIAPGLSQTQRRSYEIPVVYPPFEKYRESPPPPALMEAMGRFVEKSMNDGTLIDTGGLLPSKNGVRVRLANGKITVTDGPFSESKEVIGGHPQGGLEGRSDPDRDRVHGASPEALAGIRRGVRGAADVRTRHGAVALEERSPEPKE